MTIRNIDGRPAIDRNGLAQRWGISLATLDLRIAHDQPPATVEEAITDRRQKWWWWLDEADDWMRGFDERKRAALTVVDRSGDPDELVTAPVAARVIGYASHRGLPPGLLNIADEVVELPSGRRRRYWKRRTLWAYADNRTGKGGTGAPRGSVNRLGPAKRMIDRSGDPDELLNSTQAAHLLGYKRSASLPPALRECADDVAELPSGRKRRCWKRRTLWDFADRQAAERHERTDGGIDDSGPDRRPFEEITDREE